jgi:plastocyanin
MARFACALLLTVLLASGCGGGDDGGDKPARAATVPANGTLDMTAKEYSFDPGAITVAGAGRLTIALRNDGSLAHDIRIRKGDTEVGGTQAFAGGETRKAPVNLEHGTYEFLCTVGDHAELGMRGKLTVK